MVIWNRDQMQLDSEPRRWSAAVYWYRPRPSCQQRHWVHGVGWPENNLLGLQEFRNQYASKLLRILYLTAISELLSNWVLVWCLWFEYGNALWWLRHHRRLFVRGDWKRRSGKRGSVKNAGGGKHGTIMQGWKMREKPVWKATLWRLWRHKTSVARTQVFFNVIYLMFLID